MLKTKQIPGSMPIVGQFLSYINFSNINFHKPPRYSFDASNLFYACTEKPRLKQIFSGFFAVLYKFFGSTYSIIYEIFSKLLSDLFRLFIYFRNIAFFDLFKNFFIWLAAFFFKQSLLYRLYLKFLIFS
ncbi:MAG: hypothetical protein RsTaC01_0549 [Candidatus Paraimprobicoccus trichonymphae]|uniref:Uncharacterized protein n=1 Tax=Candidatus Paraimprobicoccus trichonymphae TaxID=3033793 RepID=A0AA48I9R0_9FIRM|nr:MAG: hypothetical protein RsTaC01_0549 [Candidatus Paraimprobicoccus trichonymphae]